MLFLLPACGEKVPKADEGALALVRHSSEGGDSGRRTSDHLVSLACDCTAFTRCASELLFFARAQRKVTKRKGPFPDSSSRRTSSCVGIFRLAIHGSVEKRRTSCAPSSGSAGFKVVWRFQKTKQTRLRIRCLVTRLNQQQSKRPLGRRAWMCAVFRRGRMPSRKSS